VAVSCKSLTYDDNPNKGKWRMSQLQLFYFKSFIKGGPFLRKH